MAIKNLASGTLAESISASATTLLVYVGNGSATTIKGVWPTTPFYATIMPSNPTAGVPNSLDSEIVKVTAVGNDQVGNTALTVVRGQKGSTTQAFAEGAIVTNADYVEEAVLLGDEGTAETPTPWVTQDDIVMSSLNFGNYSTSETDTGFKWIDGRKIYKKTMDFGALPNATNKSKSFGISNLGMFIQITGMAIYPSGVSLVLPFSGVSALEASVAINTNGDSVVITTGTNRSSATGYITAYYTKTID